MTEGRDLRVVEEFLNTLDTRTFSLHGRHRVGSDALTSVDALADWLAAHVPGTADRPPVDADLETARALRSALRATLSDDADPVPETLVPLRLVAGPDGLRLAAASGHHGLDAIVETVAENVATGRWARLKLCAAPDCRWAFYDTSRNGTGRWCSMEVCGNRHKTRAYRRRRET